ncbi:phosphodiesterase [Pontixanthobacter gangjinensis]|uniref:Phosphodiesterase n=1 Tax=Pontixanthobacter gangjinensis TaxID=1028742 RepID=A0A6I4SM36_9SPHN|nr:phosphodiesterase [Pontixanthobacter gangjinensis]MXO56180.1 phosphodiesterase [Pontixanthobacter gangjinensis]
MLIAQMTDIHIGFDPDAKPEELNRIRFRATLDRLLGGPNPIDMLVLTGDLTDHGDKESFEKTAGLLKKCEVPIYSIPGNHDTREGLLHAFPDTPTQDGFIQYAVEQDGLRILFLDTLEVGRHGGAFCEVRSAWLKAELAAHPETPTLIFMHHPPVVSGIGWMDPGKDEPWMVRFGDAIEGHSQIRAIHCGHLHRPITTTFRGILVSVTPSVAPLVAMDLRPIDPETPDHRDLITTEPPTYAIHRWADDQLLTHFEKVSDWVVLARYDAGLQGMIQGMFAERE